MVKIYGVRVLKRCILNIDCVVRGKRMDFQTGRY